MTFTRLVEICVWPGFIFFKAVVTFDIVNYGKVDYTQLYQVCVLEAQSLYPVFSADVDGMQSILQAPLRRLTSSKFLLNSHFTSIAGSMGDVENITIMIREDEFMLDVMLVTLQAASSRSAVYRQE
jgi:hypothetical protein